MPAHPDNDAAEAARLVGAGTGPVLMLSMRRMSNLVANCMLYEFEDVVAAATGADRVDASPSPVLEQSRRTYRLLRRVSGSASMARRFALRPSTVVLDRDYELFLPMFNYTHELYALATIPNWRERCRYAACYINEVWAHLLPEYLLELLSGFDHIFIGMRHPIADVARIVGRPVSLLPLAADVTRFAPLPGQPVRNIDVCHIGRRSPVTHQALMDLVSARRLACYYDTFAGAPGSRQRTFRVDVPHEHRMLLATILQRSRFYVAHRARVNEPEYTGSREEMSGRFYEGAAAGAVMIGEAPDTDDFRRLFSWPDAVIPVPYDCPEIGRVLESLSSDPQRLERISRQNVHHAALEHDWLSRLESIFGTFALSPTEGMLGRRAVLQTLAASALST